MMFLTMISSSSCSFFHHKSLAKKEAIVYPSAPDTARIQYLTTINGSNFLGKRSKFATFVLGKEEIKAINKPFGVVIRDGILYICDPGVGGIEIMDMNKGTYKVFSPGGSGQFKTPLTCIVDTNAYMYVADAGLHEVLIFDSLHNFYKRIKDTGDYKPTDVFIFENELWVTNPTRHTLTIYDKKTAEFKRNFSNYESGDDGFLYSPYNIFITNDLVYVTDFGDFKIKVFDHQGKYIKSIGSYGTGVGQFVRPKGIACDKESNLYVVDAGFENTQIFNKEGQILMFFGGPYKGPGDMWLPARVTIDYENMEYFSKYVDPAYDLKYIVIVSNQYGPDKVNIYGAVVPKK